MAIVSWQEKLKATGTLKPIAKGGSGGVYWEDYNLSDGYWRYTWTNFTMAQNPEFVEVNRMESSDA